MSRPTQILPYLFIGDKKNAKNRGVLQELNIKRILNVTPPRTVDPVAGVLNFFEKEGKFVYKRVPLFDNKGEDLLKHLEPSIAFIEAGKYHGAVFVHCQKGVSRSASVVIAYLMKQRGLSMEDALSYLKMRRSCIKPHDAFMQQLRQFEQRLLAEKTRADAAAGGSRSARDTIYDDDLIFATEQEKARFHGAKFSDSNCITSVDTKGDANEVSSLIKAEEPASNTHDDTEDNSYIGPALPPHLRMRQQQQQQQEQAEAPHVAQLDDHTHLLSPAVERSNDTVTIGAAKRKQDAPQATDRSDDDYVDELKRHRPNI